MGYIVGYGFYGGRFERENIFCEFIANELKNKFSGLRVEIAVSNRDIVEVI